MISTQATEGKARIRRIFHITSPANAAAIVHSGKFEPHSKDPLNNDNGLNCFPYRAGYQKGQCFGCSGAKLVLEWTGEEKETPLSEPPPLGINVLHDQRPWRCFIRCGSNPDLLRVVSVRFYKDDQPIKTPDWHSSLPVSPRKFLRKLWKMRKRLDDFRTDQLITIPAWYFLLPSLLKYFPCARQKLNVLRALRGKYRSKTLYLTIEGLAK